MELTFNQKIILGLMCFFIILFIYKYLKKKNKEKFVGGMAQPVVINNQPVQDLARMGQNTSLTFGRPNKCFSCEREFLKKGCVKDINYAFPGKCFSCEKQSSDPYNEGPTKCFSCDKKN